MIIEDVEYLTLPELEKQLATQKNELASLQNEFIEASTEFIKQWYAEKSKSFIVAQEEHSRALGIDGLRELKQEVQALINDTTYSVPKVLSDDQLWWHISGILASYTEGRSTNTKQDLALQMLAGTLGPIFENYGYKVVPQFIRVEAGTVYYLPLQINDGMLKAANQYKDVAALAKKTESDIEKETKARNERSIGDLWDSI